MKAALIVAFGRDCAVRGLKARTQAQQVSCARELADRLQTLGLDPLCVTPEDLTGHITWLTRRPNLRLGGRLAPRTVRMHVNAIRALYAFFVRSGLLTENPASRLSAPAVPPDHARRSLSRADIEALRSACRGPLDRGILAVFYGCGLRRSEGAALDVHDVDLHRGLLHVRSGKGGVPRSVPMGKRVTCDLAALLRRSRPPEQEALFVGARGGRLTAAGIYRRLKQVAARAEPAAGVTLHGLRHAVATHLLEAGLTLEQTRDFLGHADIGTTRIYTHVKPAEPQA